MCMPFFLKKSLEKHPFHFFILKENFRKSSFFHFLLILFIFKSFFKPPTTFRIPRSSCPRMLPHSTRLSFPFPPCFKSHKPQQQTPLSLHINIPFSLLFPHFNNTTTTILSTDPLIENQQQFYFFSEDG